MPVSAFAFRGQADSADDSQIAVAILKNKQPIAGARQTGFSQSAAALASVATRSGTDVQPTVKHRALKKK
jgi:hypothetical protein